jgi:hypothetical protein
MLAWSEGSKPLSELRGLGSLQATLAIAPQSLLDSVERFLFAEWLRQKLHGAPLHCPHTHWDIPVSGEKDDGHFDA